MARGVAVLGTERRTEGVDCAKCRSTEFAFKLSGNGQRGLSAEEIIIVDNASVLVLLKVVEILCGHLKHLSGTFAVACGDQWRVEIEISMLMEICVYCHCHIVADAHDGAESICTQTHMGILTHILERLTFLLHRIFRTADTVNIYLCSLNL